MSEPQRARGVRAEAVVFGVAAVFFGVLGARTPSDIDEGFYSTAGELVASGRVLYRDFFYPQAPLYPYALAVLHAFGHPTFVAQRVANALVAAVAAMLLEHIVHRDTRSRLLSVLATTLFATHELSWQWLPTVRPYAAATALGLAGYAIATASQGPGAARRRFTAGALGAVATGFRLLALPLVPALALAAAAPLCRRPLARTLLVLALGAIALVARSHVVAIALVASIAAIVVLATDRERRPVLLASAQVMAGAAVFGGVIVGVFAALGRRAFLFDNIGYHALRATGGLTSALESNAGYLSELVGATTLYTPSAIGTQFAMLMVFGTVAVAFAKPERIAGAWAAGLWISLLNLRPNPTHEHYYCLVVPYFVIAAAHGLHGVLGGLVGRTGTQRRALPVALGGVYVWAAVTSWDMKWNQARFAGTDMSPYRPSKIDDAARAVRQALAANGGPLLPAWEGNGIGVARDIIPGFENQFARTVADAVPAEERAMLRLRTNLEFDHAVERREPAVITVGRETLGDGRVVLTNYIRACGYAQRGEAVWDTLIFVRGGSVTRDCTHH